MSGWRGDPVWLEDVLRAEPGLEVRTLNGPSGWPWQKHGHGDFKDIWGVMVHHTGGSNTPATEIRDGVRYADGSWLKGPLSQIHLSRSGVATIVAVGVAWHAGRGDYPGLPSDNANWHTIGIEAQNNGTEGWGVAQYGAYVKTVAAILRKLGYGSARVIGHKEYAGKKSGKWDPGGMDMNQFRVDVQHQIDNQYPPVTSDPPIKESVLSALSENEQRRMFDALCHPRRSFVEGSEFETDLPTFVTLTDAAAFRTERTLEDVVKRLDRIEKKVGDDA